MEGGDRCEFDYFIIYDGIDESESVIARLCDDGRYSVLQEFLKVKYTRRQVV